MVVSRFLNIYPGISVSAHLKSLIFDYSTYKALEPNRDRFGFWMRGKQLET
jgi:hypothetical protein